MEAPANIFSTSPGPVSTSVGPVIVIDDLSDIVDLTVELLRSTGHDAHGATDGASGLRMVRELHAALVVLDFQMPGMSGAEVGAALRDGPDTHEVKIVLYSGTSAHQVRASFDAYDAFVAKPAAGELLDTVERLLAEIR